MKTLTTVAIAFLTTVCAIATQNEFEAASIRLVAPTEERVDIGMHIDGSLVRFNYLSVQACMRIAYDMKPYQLIGPEWIVTDRFNITAKLPAGASQDQVRLMLQNLLLDRFRMTVHREKRDFPVYAMTIGKGGLKLSETAPDAAADGPKSSLDVKATGSAAGVFADLGNGAYFTFADNRLIGHKLPMWRVADLLSNFMDKPVIDMTGLGSTTNYDLSLAITADDYRTMQIRAALKSGISLPPEAAQMADSGTDSLFAALDAAGIRLESRKAPQDVIVIDHADKTPTEN